MTAPSPNITDRDLEVACDAFAYYLATHDLTSGIQWVLGEVGQGRPSQVPFGYIHPPTEMVGWYTAQGRQGGGGGLAAGLDDWNIPMLVIVCVDVHRTPVSPVPAEPSDSSPFSPTNNSGFPVPYLEQPGWRSDQRVIQNIKKVFRTNPTMGGAVTDTRIVESRFYLQEVNNELYRAARLVINTQQRRLRGE